ncbi:MAG: diguanylate cyclase [Thermoleophilia bacterium]|nr:diguanylate cyclase [Thermoleophilia bacterium]
MSSRADAFELTQHVLDHIPAQVALIGPHGEIRLTNAAWDTFARENGADPAGVGVGSNYLAVCGSDGEAAVAARGIRQVLAGRLERYTFEYPCHSPTQERWFLMECKPAPRGTAVVTHFDVTQRKRAEMRLQGLAVTDPLTSVLNRRGLDESLAAEMERVNRVGASLCVLMVDCDDFKAVNDRLGHAAGDVVLRAIVERMRAELRPGDTLARVGGDEFIVLLPETDVTGAAAIAERLRLAVSAQPVAVSHDDVAVTVSMAITAADPGVSMAEDLLERSRVALKASKARGKNRATHAAELGAAARDVSGIRRAIQRMVGTEDAVAVVGQPIVDLATGATAAVELLSRCVDQPSLAPQTFLRAAAEEHLLHLLDERCFGACLRACAVLAPATPVHLNLYPSTLLSLSADELAEVLRAAGGRAVCLELSEQQVIGDPAAMLTRAAAVRAAGATLALDDVGFGRTSLETLVVLEPEVVKIDRSCVRGVDRDPTRLRWLERLVRVSGALGADVVGEGVETAAEAGCLREIGIAMAQGFHYASPLPLSELAARQPEGDVRGRRAV